MASKVELKRTAQFKDYLENSGYRVTNSGRINICPVCGGKETSQLYDGKIMCFKPTCKLGEEGQLEIEEYIYLFGKDDERELIDLDDITIKKDDDIVVDERVNSEIYTEAIKFFHGELLSDKKALQHLYDRGRTDESIKEFEIGVVAEVDKLYNRLKHQYTPDQLEDCGLFKFDKDGDVGCTFWRGEYTFPVYWKGRIVNIKSKNMSHKDRKGGWIAKRYTGDNYKRFLNSKALTQQEVILVEGEHDCMRLWEMGKKNAVCVFGGPDNNQIKYLKNQKDKIYSLCFDNDDAGEAYTKKFVDAFKGVKQHKVFVVNYDGEDPDTGDNFDWDGISSDIVLDEMAKDIAKEVENQSYEFGDKYVKVEVGSKIVYANKIYRNQWLNHSGMVEKYIYKKDALYKWLQSETVEFAERGVCCDYTTTDFVVDDQFNMFDGFKIKPEKGRLPVKWLEFVKEVICENNNEYFNYFIDWLSDMYQNPNSSTAIVPVIISEQGVGKGALTTMIENIIGEKYATRIDNMENIFGMYNEVIENKLFINLDEATFGRSKKEQGRLKSLTGNSTITINGKYRPAYDVDFSCRFIVTSNDFTPVGVEEGDRRFFVLQASDKYVNNKSYYDELWKEVYNKDMQAALLYFLENRNIDSSYNRYVVKDTAYKLDMIGEVIDSVGQWLYEVDDGLADQDCDWRLKVQSNKISVKDLHSCYLTWYDKNLSASKYEERLTVRKFSALMRKKYWRKKKYKVVKTNGLSVKGFEL
jgi:hypothetical protein